MIPDSETFVKNCRQFYWEKLKTWVTFASSQQPTVIIQQSSLTAFFLCIDIWILIIILTSLGRPTIFAAKSSRWDIVWYALVAHSTSHSQEWAASFKNIHLPELLMEATERRKKSSFQLALTCTGSVNWFCALLHNNTFMQSAMAFRKNGSITGHVV